ncbi:MAG: hypothetical protein AUH86_10500 [Acidobacteria bacterium 13_1_40CM_4_58_4]|nr:MAG: hypothetical protein AUH86_10500 [Acidobacteria bacterium 13_1_40CM_4_58_4]
MSETSLVTPASPSEKVRDRALLAGIGLSSFAALLLELALTRLFSVVLFYHFAFLAISIALLGLGAGGVFAYLGKNWLARFETRRLVARLCNLNALIVPIVLVVVSGAVEGELSPAHGAVYGIRCAILRYRLGILHCLCA